MATATLENISRQFTDLDLNFNIHPVRKDINKIKNEMAIINAVKNIVLTSHYEKPFNPDYGSNVRKLLFENLDIITASAIEREISQSIANFEPRVKLIGVTAKPDFENNAFSIQMQFYILNQTAPVSISFLLERIR
jgi:phage baseplate assembly protein W